MPPDRFLSCDWGTTRFRLRLVEIETGRIVAEMTSDAGVAKLAAEHPREARPEVYRQTLLSGIETLQTQVDCDLTNSPVMISGMASSSLGWCELAYAKLPFALSGESAVWKRLEPLRSSGEDADVYLLSGACSDEDVMRGEETELMGAWSAMESVRANGNGLVILPGTHSKHLEIRNNTLVGFRTYMTGELFDVLGRHSVLRHSLPQNSAGSVAASSGADSQNRDAMLEPFLSGVAAGSSRMLSNALFLVRTKSLLCGMTPGESEAYLSGILIGAELSEVVSPEADNMPVLLCAGEELSYRYQAALESLPLHQQLIIIPPFDVSRLAAVGQSVLLRTIQAN